MSIKKIYFGFLGLLTAFTLQVEAHLDSSGYEEKVYVQLEDLVFGQNGIFLANFIEGVEVQLTSLHTDARGYYFIPTYALTWVCPEGHENKGPLTCRICGKGPDGIKRY